MVQIVGDKQLKELLKVAKELGHIQQYVSNYDAIEEEIMLNTMMELDELEQKKRQQELLNKASNDLLGVLKDAKGSWLVKEVNNSIWDGIGL